ncbi:hypothetical protein B0J18DRAFT_300040 [Chaetomium sp. MPI-SDFR-AT-0129]|nr:hypothetical protein B0J18DRAFT_300040 [Chaetomium sp. MPI-SDFR-AT-0129]
MKAALVAGILAATLAASGSVRIEHNPDGSFRVMHFRDAPETPHGKQPPVRRKSCRDNCLRAVMSASIDAPEFCNWFLAAPRTVKTNFGPVQSQCLEASRVSSACSGIAQPVTVSTASPTSSIEAVSSDGILLTGTSTGLASTGAVSNEPSSIPTESISSLTPTGSSTELPVDPSCTESSIQPSATPTCSPAGGHCTLQTFMTDCCPPQGSDLGVGCFFATGDPQNGVCFY